MNSLAWKAPTAHLKLNMDSAVFANQQFTKLGCVLQNERGEVLMAATTPVQNYGTLLETDRTHGYF